MNDTSITDNPFLSTRDRVRLLLGQGLSQAETARRIGCSKEWVRQVVEKDNLPYVKEGRNHKDVCANGHDMSVTRRRVPSGASYCHQCRLNWGYQKYHGTPRPANFVSPKDKTHCVHGHALTEENTIRNPDGTRKCRECHRRRTAVTYARRRARQQEQEGNTPSPCPTNE